MNFYDKIKEDIKATNLNVAEFARRVGVSRDTVYKLGEGTAISTYFKIIEVLGKKPSDYFNEKEKDYKTVAGLDILQQEGEVYGVVDYKQKYYEALEKLDNVNNKLNEANERLLAFMDVKKEVIKKGK